MTTPKPGDVVQINFLDHYQSDGTDMRTIPCEVFGRLVGEDDTAYYIVWWICDANPHDHNSETIIIVKHKGLKIKRLK